MLYKIVLQDWLLHLEKRSHSLFYPLPKSRLGIVVLD